MAHDICPWWHGYFLASPIRRLRHNPRAILKGSVTRGMTVLEPGPGMGFFTMELARLVGPTGKVVAVDVQDQMLKRLDKKLQRAGTKKQADLRLAGAKDLGVGDLKGKVDFALAFAMVHEVPDAGALFRDIHASLKAGGKLLLSEPAGHVSANAFGASVTLALKAGFVPVAEPSIRSMRSVMLQKKPGKTAAKSSAKTAPKKRAAPARKKATSAKKKATPRKRG
jgi:ubiquinone/menaquinone biosynthesis C-methylase UbiE